MEANFIDVDNLDLTDEPSLNILKDVQKLYEDKLQLIRTRGRGNKLQLENCLLQNWVKDLVEQNNLLAIAVDKLETEAVKRIYMLEQRANLEQRKHSEIVSELQMEKTLLQRQMARKDSDLRGLVEILRRLRELDDWSVEGVHFFEVTESDIFGSTEWRKQNNKDRGDKQSKPKKQNQDALPDTNELKIKNDALEKENKSKDREIKKLNEDLQQLRSQISRPVCSSTRDVDVSVRLCCPDTQCGDVEPVRDYSALLKEESDKYEAKMTQLEDSLKSSVESQRYLRQSNVQLSEEVNTLRRVCCTLDEQCRGQSTRAQFKDEIIREMRRQLKQAKAKIFYDEGGDKFTSSTPKAHLPESSFDSPNTSINQSQSRQGSVYSCKDEDVSSRECDVDARLLSCTDSAPIGCSSMDEVEFYKNKLLSIVQIMTNKDEMLKIQIDSLQLAEQRILKLTERNIQLQTELDKKNNEAKRGSDVTITNLKTNISVIENLYRDSFYESARQAEMVETLRNSFLEVRQSSTEQSDEIGRLQGIIISQKWDLEKCQNIAEELETLKSEIANVLNNANNDSGMWERSEDSLQNEICQDLNEISEQLLQLKDILHVDCNYCDARILDDNKLLKLKNEQLNSDLTDLQSRIAELKKFSTNNDETVQQYIDKIKANEAEIERLSNTLRESEHCREELLRDKKQLLREKEEQCHRENYLRSTLQEAEKISCHCKQTLEERALEITSAKKCVSGLKDRLKNVKFEVKCKTTECERLSELCKAYEDELKNLKEEMSSAQVFKKEALWQNELAESSRRVREMERQLAATRAAYQELQVKFRDKSESVEWLEHELVEASTRGADLCAESRHVVSGMRHWMQRMRQQHQLQQKTIQQLQHKLEEARQRQAECESRLSEGYSHSYPGENCTSRNFPSNHKSRCSVERYLTDGSSSGAGSSGMCQSPSPPPQPPPRLPPCRSCETVRCPGRVPQVMCAKTRMSPVSPSENLMMSLDNTGNRFNAESYRRPAKRTKSVKIQNS